MSDTTTKRPDWMMDTFVPFAKWWFDMLRSFFVVALLAYVAQKTANIYLKFLSQFSTSVFCVYIGVYLTELLTPHFRFAHSIKIRPLKWAAFAVIIGFASYYSYRWIEVITAAIEEVVRFQTR